MASNVSALAKALGTRAISRAPNTEQRHRPPTEWPPPWGAARIVAFGDDLWLDVMMLGDGNPLPLATPTSLKFTSRLGGMIPVGLLTIC